MPEKAPSDRGSSSSTAPSGPGAFWDSMYAGAVYRYGTRPNTFLRHQAYRFRPRGRVLCLGDGEGRNGVWLAEQGFAVTSVDASAEGLRKARALAAARSVRIETVRAELPGAELPESAFDAVVLTFLHLPPETRSRVHREAVSLLRPGGIVVLEAFTPAQLRHDSGGPRSEALLYTATLLRDDFDTLDIATLQETETKLDEGPGHQGTAAVVRLVGIRPGPAPSDG